VSSSGPLGDLAAIIREAAFEDLPALVGRLREGELLAELRLRSGPATNGNGRQEQSAEQDKWITPEEAASIAGVKPGRIYGWAKAARWASRPSRRCLRINEHAFRRWLAARAR
jgi:hypothetical protein